MGCMLSAESQQPAEAPIIEEYEAPPKDPLLFDEDVARAEAEHLELDACLADDFAQHYLLRFAQTEFSSENIAFLIGLRTLLHRLPRDDLQQLCKRSQELVRTHVQSGAILEVQLPPSLQQQLSKWLKVSSSDEGGGQLPAPMDAWDEAYKVVFRQVKFDIFPRFRRSRAAAEWATLQLRRCLRSPAFCEAFCGEGSSTAFSPLQRQALDFYRAVLDYQSSYVALASGWPSDSSAQSAKRVYCAYEGAWAELGLPPDVHTHIQKQLPAATASLFEPVLVPALNALEALYDAWLDSAAGVALCSNLVGLTRLPKPTVTLIMGDAVSDASEYATAW